MYRLSPVVLAATLYGTVSLPAQLVEAASAFQVANTISSLKACMSGTPS